MKFKELRLCKENQAKEIKRLINYSEFCNTQNTECKTLEDSNIENITSKDLKVLLSEENNNIIILDVRTKSEQKVNSIKESILIPLDTIENGEAIEKIKKICFNKQIYVHCQTGKRSVKAIKLLRKYGIEAINLIGGISSWENS